MSRTGTHALLQRLTRTVVLLGTLICARPAWADPLTVMWDLNSESDVIGYLVYIGTQPGSYTQAVDVRNTNTYVFTNAAPGQRSYFVVVAYNGQLMSAPSSEVSAVGAGTPPANQPPNLVNPGNQSGRVGQSILLQLSGSDPEGLALSYSASGLPTGLSASASGRISGVPTTPGTYSVTASVSDGSLASQRSFTWVISSVDQGLINPGAGSQEPTIDHSLARHASSASTYTGTVATSRVDAPPESARTILRSPSESIGSVTGSGVSAGSYSGTSAVIRTVALDQPDDAARVYTGRTALPRPIDSGGVALPAGSGSTQSILRNPPSLDAQPSDADAQEQPVSTDGTDTNLLTAAPRRTAIPASSSAPTVSIETPVNQATFAAGSTVIFSAVALDVEDGNLSAQIVWTSSVDGRIGTGALFSRVLSSGSHTITASVTDSKGNTRSAQVSVLIQ